MSLLQLLSDNNPTDESDSYTEENQIKFLLDELKMLFSSRTFFTYIGDVPLVNSSILNYGIDENMVEGNINNQQFDLIEQYIEILLSRFEPRFASVSVAINKVTIFKVYIEISAWYENYPIKLMLDWDIERRRFNLNE
ncbi:gpW/GP25 family protein (plasmid) [Enterobacter soli]|uniref:GPW/gp25 family protein n=1 Tax=Enterobacter soli TaxID=885040 RepID=UPI000223CFF4|nr:GPW/gp25 family protein [Enterobacter soli]AEN67303.1 gpW/GP25 family protein [Enterobacter soli]OAT35223.1 anti-adapter protein [Enterobacter soli ATCC BAA-2102]